MPVVASICSTPSLPSDAASRAVAGRADALATRWAAAARAALLVPVRASSAIFAALSGCRATGSGRLGAAADVPPAASDKAPAVTTAVPTAMNLLVVERRIGTP